MLLRPSKQSGTSVGMCAFPCVRACVSLRVRDNRTQTGKEVLSLTISAARLSICVCQPVFVTGAPASVLASERVCIHILTEDALPVSPHLPVRRASLPAYHAV